MGELLFDSESPTCIQEFMIEIKSHKEIIDPGLKIQPLTPLWSKLKGHK